TLSHSVDLAFFFNDSPTTEIYTLSLHDALPILALVVAEKDVVARLQALDEVVLEQQRLRLGARRRDLGAGDLREHHRRARGLLRSEEHTSELQSLAYLVCRLLLEKKKNKLNQIS